MAKTITFKPEFEAKLKKLRIKTKFVKNLKNPNWPYSQHAFYKYRFDNAKTWYDFIEYAFQWSNTPEGFDYWCNIQDL